MIQGNFGGCQMWITNSHISHRGSVFKAEGHPHLQLARKAEPHHKLTLQSKFEP